MYYYERRAVRNRRRIVNMAMCYVSEIVSEFVVGFLMLAILFCGLPVVATIFSGIFG